MGVHLVPLLLDAGHRVRLLSRTRPAEAIAGRVEHVAGDLKDRESVRRALAGIETVYHLAGLVSFNPKDGRQMYELHVDCTRELLKDAKAAGVRRMILASTSGTIAVSKTERIGTEEDDYPFSVVGRWPYYLSKIYEEKLALDFCRLHALPLVVLNPSLLLGPSDARLSSTWLVAKFLEGQIPAMPSGGLSYVDVRDAASSFLAALTRGDVGGRHLLGANVSFDDFFARLERMTGVSAPRLKLPSPVNVFGSKLLEKWDRARGRDARLEPHAVEIGEHFFYLDASKAERELGFQARDLHDTLFDTVNDLLARLPPGHLPGTRGKLCELRQDNSTAC